MNESASMPYSRVLEQVERGMIVLVVLTSFGKNSWYRCYGSSTRGFPSLCGNPASLRSETPG